MANIEKTSVESLTSMLIQGKLDVNALNLAYANQRTAFVNAIQQRPHLLEKISKANLEHFIPVAFKESPEYFLYLKKEQYTDSFVQTYLLWRLEKNDKAQKANNAPAQKDFFFQKSFDGNLIFQYNYTSSEDDRLYYADKELQVPLSIKSSFKINLKLVDALDFLRKLDIDVAAIGENKIKTALTDLLNAKYKAFLYDFICKNDLGYYSLCVSVSELEESFKKEIAGDLKEYGLEVRDFIIKAFAIPKEIQNKIEDLAFQLRQQRAEADASSALAKIALDNYESKLIIEEKHPSATHSLTEYEKDQALKRYLIKNGRFVEEEVDRSIKIKQNVETQDVSLEKDEDVVPEIEPKKNTFKRGFFTLLLLSLFISLIVLFTEGAGVGCIMLGVTTLIFGLVAAFNREKFKSVPIEITQGDLQNGKHE